MWTVKVGSEHIEKREDSPCGSALALAIKDQIPTLAVEVWGWSIHVLAAFGEDMCGEWIEFDNDLRLREWLFGREKTPAVVQFFLIEGGNRADLLWSA